MNATTRHPQKLASKTGDDGFRHEKRCVWSGETLVRHSLNDPYCICDPHGTKARAKQVWMEKYNRRHVLSQDEIWYPREGDPVRLEDMSLRWKRNLFAFLERRAAALHESAICSVFIVAANHDGGQAAQDSLDSIAEEVMETEPADWLHQQPLVVKLQQLIESEQDGPVDRVAIPVGTCITTDCDRPTVEGSQSCAEHTAEAIHGTADQR